MQGLTSIIEEASVLLKTEAVELLKQLIAIPSFSKEENKTADLLESFLTGKGIEVKRKANNVWAINKYFRNELPSILLNSHHDTVKPGTAYTKGPFTPEIKEEKLFGLGSNDAGGALVSLLTVFLYYYEKKDLKYNIIFCAGAEEEISGANGIESVIPDFPSIDFAIVGEPTKMDLAIAEKGLIVLDCFVYGTTGHAAREEGDNTIYKAIRDIEWFKNFSFPKISETLGPVKMNVTMMQSGTQHNVVPSVCQFTVDVRTTDAYTNEEIVEIIKQNVSCEVKPRSLRLEASFISIDHPFVQTGIKYGRKTYGSPTLSDQSLMPWPSVKMGPGDSARSHTADEFIYINEIEDGIDTYINILDQILL